jgi:hypothetical protein
MFGTQDFKEGTTAFLEKRKAVLLEIRTKENQLFFLVYK